MSNTQPKQSKEEFYRGRRQSQQDDSIRKIDLDTVPEGQQAKDLQGSKRGEYSNMLYPVQEQLSRHASQYMQNSVRMTSKRQWEDHEDEGYKSKIKVVPVALLWENLKYSVPIKKGLQASKKNSDKPASKIILQGLSGVCLPGQLTAIMGPTGCGKTSVLNTLAGRLPPGGKVTGKIFVNGQPRDNDFIRYSAYVLQDDVLFKTLTVEETFQIAATLRLPRTISRKEKFSVADQIINELGLTKVRKTFVGDAFFRGVSGGERKRVNIGTEMMGNPSIMFLDEPTSGLDSFQALSVMKTLQNMSSNGRNIVSVIHQPRSQIYQMFDTLYLLSEGRVIYFGNAQTAADYFKKLGFPCPKTFNPSDFFLDVISMDYRSSRLEQDSRKRINLLADTQLKNQEQKDYFEYAKAKSQDYKPVQRKDKGDQFKRNTVFTEFGILYWRANVQMLRDRFPLIILLVQNIVIACIIGAIYSNTKYDASGVTNRLGLLFFITINISFSQLFGTLSTFPAEKNMINKERAANMYLSFSYYLSKIVAEAPIKALPIVLFSACIYFLARLNPHPERFFRFLAFLILMGLNGQSIGYFCSAPFKNQMIPLTIAPALNVVFLLYGGFFLTGPNLPRGSFWVKYVTPQFYAWTGLVNNEFDDDRIQYTISQDCNGQQSTYTLSGQDILNRPYDPRTATGIPMWEAYLILIVIVIIMHFFATIFLTVTKQKFASLKVEKDDQPAKATGKGDDNVTTDNHQNGGNYDNNNINGVDGNTNGNTVSNNTGGKVDNDNNNNGHIDSNSNDTYDTNQEDNQGHNNAGIQPGLSGITEQTSGASANFMSQPPNNNKNHNDNPNLANV